MFQTEISPLASVAHQGSITKGDISLSHEPSPMHNSHIAVATGNAYGNVLSVIIGNTRMKPQQNELELHNSEPDANIRTSNTNSSIQDIGVKMQESINLFLKLPANVLSSENGDGETNMNLTEGSQVYNDGTNVIASLASNQSTYSMGLSPTINNTIKKVDLKFTSSRIISTFTTNHNQAELKNRITNLNKNSFSHNHSTNSSTESSDIIETNLQSCLVKPR